MKWILIVVVVLIVVVALVALVGWRLPQSHIASRQARLPVPPDVVWQTITNVDAFPQWRKDIKRVERLPDRNGYPVWVEHGGSDAMTLAIERSEPPRLLVVRIADEKAPFGGTWTYRIESAPGGSVLTITEHGEIYNPIFRFVARHVLGYEGTLNKYLAELTRKL
jgi:uncharacterized protein YndB with AHSA1/START domain